MLYLAVDQTVDPPTIIGFNEYPNAIIALRNAPRNATLFAKVAVESPPEYDYEQCGDQCTTRKVMCLRPLNHPMDDGIGHAAPLIRRSGEWHWS